LALAVESAAAPTALSFANGVHGDGPGGDSGGEHRSQGDERAGQDGEDERPCDVHVGFLDAGLFGLDGYLCR
jgi:hypothetical protein